MAEPLLRQRLDKWLWAARFYKTRALAADEVVLGRVLLAGKPTKPAHDVKPGDMLTLRQNGGIVREVQVLALGARRGSAAEAQLLYAETPESRATREAAAAARLLAPEPALAIQRGRPTKRDRRALQRAQQASPRPGWGKRWSAEIP